MSRKNRERDMEAWRQDLLADNATLHQMVSIYLDTYGPAKGLRIAGDLRARVSDIEVVLHTLRNENEVACSLTGKTWWRLEWSASEKWSEEK